MKIILLLIVLIGVAFAVPIGDSAGVGPHETDAERQARFFGLGWGWGGFGGFGGLGWGWGGYGGWGGGWGWGRGFYG